MGIVRVDDIRPQALDDARQPPRRRQVHLAARSDWDEVEAFFHAPAQLAVRMCDERRPLAERPKAVHGQEHLVLAAPPGARRVDV